jgi:hypothetical protein
LPDSRPGFWNANAVGILGHGFINDEEVVEDEDVEVEVLVTVVKDKDVEVEVLVNIVDELVVEFWEHGIGLGDAAPFSAKGPGRGQLRSQPLLRPTCRPGYSI